MDIEIDREELITCIGRNIDLAQGVIQDSRVELTRGAPLARNSPSKKHLENDPAKNPELVPKASQNGAIFDAWTW